MVSTGSKSNSTRPCRNSRLRVGFEKGDGCVYHELHLFATNNNLEAANINLRSWRIPIMNCTCLLPIILRQSKFDVVHLIAPSCTMLSHSQVLLFLFHTTRTCTAGSCVYGCKDNILRITVDTY